MSVQARLTHSLCPPTCTPLGAHRMQQPLPQPGSQDGATAEAGLPVRRGGGVADDLAHAPFAGRQTARVAHSALGEQVYPLPSGGPGCRHLHDRLRDALAPVHGQDFATLEELPAREHTEP